MPARGSGVSAPPFGPGATPRLEEDGTRHPAWWGFHPPRDGARSLLELIADGTLDAELAGLLWLLLERRVPILVAGGPPLAGKTTLLTALLELLPPPTRRIVLRGAAEEFEWLPDAGGLGWTPGSLEPARAAIAAELLSIDGGPTGQRRPAAAADSSCILAAELSSHLPVYTWGVAARTTIRAAGRGFGLAATIHGDSLEDVLDQLAGREVGLSADELSLLGVVLVVRPVARPGAGLRRRVVAAHYLRPLMRDAAGHLQRAAPAVLATWDERSDAFEHFEWGIAAELAGRLALRTGDFEHERTRRAEYLAALIRAGARTADETRAAVAAYGPRRGQEPSTGEGRSGS